MNEDTRERPVETSLFWLSSRYYSPELCRFISLDDVSYLNPKSVNGLNLYSYCYNNPISYYDPSGHIAVFVVTAIIEALIGFGIAAYNDYKEDENWFNGSVGSYIGYTLGGAAIGAIDGMTASSLVAGNMFANFKMFYTGLKGLAWAYSMGGSGAASLYMANNFSNSIHANSSWLGYYPGNNGFSGQPQTITLQPGTIIQRIGDEGGRYVAPYFSDPLSLSLPYNQLANMYIPTLYVVNEPITVLSGQVAPWFYQYGGGTQYILPQTIEKSGEILSKL